MFAGNTKAALTLLSDHPRRKRLHLDEFVDTTGKTVRDIRTYGDKHPPAAPLHADCLISDSSTVPDYHSIIFDGLDGTVVCEAALHTSGEAGPSGVDT